MTEHLWWYLSRSTGIVTLVASGGAVIWGLLLSTRVIQRRSLPKWLLDLHRFLGAVTIASLGLHLVTIVADSYVTFGPADLLVPGHSAWRTGAIAWGIVGAYLLVAVQVTSLLKRRLQRRVWRWTHVTSLPAFALSLTHAATAGTDTSNRVYLVVATLLGLTVVFLGSYRLLARVPATRAPRVTGEGG